MSVFTNEGGRLLSFSLKGEKNMNCGSKKRGDARRSALQDREEKKKKKKSP